MQRRLIEAAIISVAMSMFLLTVGASEPDPTLRGCVSSVNGKLLAGVTISDGCRVVRTDENGGYQLPIDKASGPFVFVTLPRGFWSDEFYEPIATAVDKTSVDFVLEQIEQPDRFDFAFLADMHLERREIGGAKLNATLAEIGRLSPMPAFLLFQGDICLQSGSGDLYAECLKTVDVPMRHGAGNHEMILDHEDPRDDFQQRFGPTYYSFDWGPMHCIVLDGNKPIPGETGWQAVHGAVEGSELKWLEADLKAQPQGKPIVVGVHIPIVSSYPERRSSSPENAPYWEMTNRKMLTDLFARHGVRLVLQGHMHENERSTIGGVEYVSSISVSGCWWTAGQGFERGVDNSPRGYRVVSVDGQSVTHHYQSSAESRVARIGEFYDLDKPLAPDAETHFVFNCYDAPNEATAVARIDNNGPWLPMPAFAAPSPATAGLSTTHHYRLTINTTEMDSGHHSIAVRVTYPNGEVAQAVGSFELLTVSLDSGRAN